LRTASLLDSCSASVTISRLLPNDVRHVGADYDKIERTAGIGVSDLLPIGLTGAGNQNVERPSGAVTLISSALERRLT
jgi:hypothetical protein